MMHTLYTLALSFGKIGMMAFGGGNAILKMIEFEVVSNRAWLTSQEFAEMTGVSFLFPGLTGLKLSALIGFKVGGILGCLTSIVAMNVPAILLTVFGVYAMKSFSNDPRIIKLVVLVQYAAAALLLAGAYTVIQPLLKSKFDLKYLICSLIFLGTLIFFDFSPFLGLIVFIGVLFFI